MQNRNFFGPIVFMIVWCAALLLLNSDVARAEAAGEEGTLGIVVSQLYSPQTENHRGNLVVLNVEPEYPAAKAGLHAGDIILEINGVAAQGRDVAAIRGKELAGPAGGTVKLKVGNATSGELREVTLTRQAYRPYENPASDPFHYSAPGNWHSERHTFPLEWAPSIAYSGIADLMFAPGFNDENSPEFFSYVGFWWLKGKHQLSAEQLQKDLLTYYRGLSEDFGKMSKFTPDMNKITASLKPNSGSGAPVFRGDVSTYTGQGKLITLHVDTRLRTCPTSDNTYVVFSLSPAARDQQIWKQMQAVGESFKCKG